MENKSELKLNNVRMSVVDARNPKPVRRAFGRVIQVQAGATSQLQLIKPPNQQNVQLKVTKRNLNDAVEKLRAQAHDQENKPSPSKRAREVEDENARGPWGGGDDKKNNKHEIPASSSTPAVMPASPARSSTTGLTCSEVFSPSPLIPYSSGSDLNNSFTEKISNLGIQCVSAATPNVNSFPPINKVSRALNGENPESEPLDLIVTKLPSGSNKNKSLIFDPEHPFVNDILDYWDEQEKSHRINPNYMARQHEVTWKHFTILTDWMVEVVDEYKLHVATLHRAVSYLHRFLSRYQISKANLQLLGTTCIFIAAKIEEVTPPETADLVHVTDDTYTKSQVTSMEGLLLSALDFELLLPTSHEFTEYFGYATSLSPMSLRFAKYVTELALLSNDFLPFRPSVFAFASCYVASRVCTNDYFSVISLLAKVPKYNTRAFVEAVEGAIQPIYTYLLSTGHENSSNSVCTKYPEFQNSRILKSVASSAAVCDFTWC